MTEIRIVRATTRHARQLAPRLREADRLECEALGHTPLHALVLGLRWHECWAALEGSLVIGMFGCGQLEGEPVVGVPWLVGSPEILRHRREIVRLGREYVARWSGMYGVLFNLTLSNNTASLAWLRSLGFETGPPIERNGWMWMPFTREVFTYV